MEALLKEREAIDDEIEKLRGYLARIEKASGHAQALVEEGLRDNSQIKRGVCVSVKFCVDVELVHYESCSCQSCDTGRSYLSRIGDDLTFELTCPVEQFSLQVFEQKIKKPGVEKINDTHTSYSREVCYEAVLRYSWAKSSMSVSFYEDSNWRRVPSAPKVSVESTKPADPWDN